MVIRLKTSKFRKAANRASWFFTAAALAYTLTLAVVMPETNESVDIYGVLFKNIATLFGFSCVFGASFLLFDTALPSSAKRFLHVLVLYVATLISVFIMGKSGSDAREVIIFIFAATLLYTVIYTASVLISKAVKRFFAKIR